MKVILRNSLLVGLISTFVLLSCDNISDEQKWEGAIQTFIYEHEEDFYNYRALGFQKIDKAFFEKQGVIRESLLILQDTTQRRVSQLHLANLSEEAEKLQPYTSTFDIDQIDEFLSIRAQIDQNLEIDNPEFEALLKTEEATITYLDQILSTFNLSIYSLDFENQDVIYFHEFLMDGEERSAIIEVGRDTHEVISFKELS